MSWWVYLLRCGDGTLYTGITDDLDRRLAAHNAGRGAKYTRSRRPVTLVWREEQPDKSAALRRGESRPKNDPGQKEGLGGGGGPWLGLCLLTICGAPRRGWGECVGGAGHTII